MSDSYSSLQPAPLRYVKLATANRLMDRNEVDSANKYSSSEREIHSTVAKALGNEPWLLEDGQDIQLPSTNVDASKVLFSLSDFVVRADRAVEQDLQAAAFDDSGGRRLLSASQLEELKQTGQLTVPSILLKDQVHVWRVSPWFFSGRKLIVSSFLDGIGAGLDHLFVYTWSTPKTSGFRPSWISAIRQGFMKSFRTFMDLIPQITSAPIRRPKYNEIRIRALIQTAEQGYILCQMEKKGFDSRRFLGTSIRLEQKAHRGWDELVNLWDMAPECRPSSSLITDAANAQQVIQKEKQAFEAGHRSSDFRKEAAIQSPMSARMEAERSEKAEEKKMTQRFIEHLCSHPTSHQGGLFQSEGRRLEVEEIEAQVKEDDEEELSREMEEWTGLEKQKHPLLSLSKARMNRRFLHNREVLRKQLEASRTRRVLSQLKESPGLEVESEIRRLQLEFREEHEKSLEYILACQNEPISHTFHEILLNPKKWTVDNSTYSFNRYQKVDVSLDKWFWRIRYIWLTFLCTTKTLIASSYHFFVNGPLSLRALFSSSPFYAMKRPSRSVPGEFEDEPSSFTPTLISRLTSFLAALRRIREDFEAQPDDGLIGKPIQRIFFEMKSTLKGITGVVLISLFMLIGSFLSSLLTGATLVASPFLASAWTILCYGFDLVIYDFAAMTWSPVFKIVSAAFYLVLPGIAQGALATVLHVVIHPVIGLVKFGWATTRAALRSLRDGLTGLILFRSAKTPLGDTFLAKREHGPGVTSTAYYRLPLPAAKAGVDLILRQALFHSHVAFRDAELREPFRRYESFMNIVLSPFGSKASILADSPWSICEGLVSVAKKRIPSLRWHSKSRLPGDKDRGIWDEIGESIRLANPDVKEQVQRDTAQGNETLSGSIEAYKSRIKAEIKVAAETLNPSKNAYDMMSSRTGQLMAEIFLWRQFQDHRTSHMIAIPSHARGRFRLSEADMKELWLFAMARTEEYGERIRDDLLALARNSVFEDALTREANDIVESFWKKSKFRSSEDATVVASSLLADLLGDDTMLECMEDIDKKLVIDPFATESDDHLRFFESIV